jgi:outer membrane protein OmpA-like peptidoglycan-associated protein
MLRLSVTRSKQYWLGVLGVVMATCVQAASPELIEDPGKFSNPEAWSTLLRAGEGKQANGDFRSAAPMRVPVNVKINFKLNSAQIASEWQPPLKELATLLEKNQKMALMVEGHTDARGLPEYNEKLSAKRAEAVKEFLTMHAPSAKSRVTSVGRGSRSLLMSDPMDGRNRRVSFTVQ